MATEGSWSLGELNEPRHSHTATLLPDGRVLIAGGTGTAVGSILDSFEIFDPVTDTWTLPAETLNQARTGHTATLLPDGRVLVVGGFLEGMPFSDSVEIFDPVTETWELTTGTLNQGRRSHTATLLVDGRVLIAGGVGSGVGWTSSVEIFDPATETWELSTETLNQERADHTATLLSDGRVLVAGGYGVVNGTGFLQELVGTEVFDPVTESWTSMGDLAEPRKWHAATLLPDGRVLVAGGFNASSDRDLESTEIFDPVSDTWTLASETLNQGRSWHTATLLADGRVVVAGGGGAGLWNTLFTFEILAPPITLGLPAETLNQARADHTATLLPDGRVLIAGGRDPATGWIPSVEIFDPATETWELTTETLNQARAGHTATLLPDGRVLVAGGYNPVRLKSVEIFDPATETWNLTTETLNQARTGHTATVLPDGRVLVVGGFGEPNTLESVEIFDPATETWNSTTALNQARADHTATLLPDGRVLVVGGRGTPSDIILESVELFDPVTETWNLTTEPLIRARAWHTATLLVDGRVLIAGGRGSGTGAIPIVEIFDPATGAWRLGTLTHSRENHTATLFIDGRVLVTGGDGTLRRFETFEPLTGTWTLSLETPAWRSWHTATLMTDGRVLIAGGIGMSTEAIASFEIFSPKPVSGSRRPSLFSILSNAPVTAMFDSTFGAPVCQVTGPACDSISLLRGRDDLFGAEEPNAPNTVDAMTDGSAGGYRVDGSVERIRVLSPGGARLTAGQTATVEVTLWASSEGDWLEIFSATEPASPVWTLLTQLGPSPGFQTLSHSFNLPAGGLQAIRAHLFRSSSPGTYDDYDDLVFAVSTSEEPLFDPVVPGEVLTVTGTGFDGDSEASDGSTQSSPVNYPVTFLRSVESDRVFHLTPDPRPNFSDDPMQLSFSQLPVDLDLGQYYLSVVSSGVPSVSRLVEVAGCSGLTIAGQPADVTVPVGSTATFVVDSHGGRWHQWESCLTNNCDPETGDWMAVPGANEPSYTTDVVVAADSGTKYRMVVRTGCGLSSSSCSDLPGACLRSAPRLLLF
jgi:N-acetylneuraminic acid mutarotase